MGCEGGGAVVCLVLLALLARRAVSGLLFGVEQQPRSQPQSRYCVLCILMGKALVFFRGRDGTAVADGLVVVWCTRTADEGGMGEGGGCAPYPGQPNQK